MRADVANKAPPHLRLQTKSGRPRRNGHSGVGKI